MTDPEISKTLPNLPDPDFYDPVIEELKKKVDRAALRENLKLTVEERLLKAERTVRAAREAEEARRQELIAMYCDLNAELQALLEVRRAKDSST